MVTYEEAYEIAIKWEPQIASCTEYEGGFWFDPYNDLKEDEVMIGGLHSPFAIPKSGKHEGKHIPIPLFIIDCNMGKALWGCEYNHQSGEIIRELTSEEVDYFNETEDDDFEEDDDEWNIE